MVRVEDICEAAEAEPGFASPAGAIGVTVRNMSAKVPGVTWVMSAMSAGTARAATVVLHAGKQYRGSEKLVVESARSQFPPDTAIPMPALAVSVSVAAAATAARRAKRRRGGEEGRLGELKRASLEDRYMELTRDSADYRAGSGNPPVENPPIPARN